MMFLSSGSSALWQTLGEGKAHRVYGKRRSKHTEGTTLSARDEEEDGDDEEEEDEMVLRRWKERGATVETVWIDSCGRTEENAAMSMARVTCSKETSIGLGELAERRVWTKREHFVQ